MNVPEAAIEAAAEALVTDRYGVRNPEIREQARRVLRPLANAVVEAAMPAIREHIANELHAALCTDPNCEDVCVGAANAVEVVLEGFEL